MAISNVFQNFPQDMTYVQDMYQFQKNTEIGDFDWQGSGHYQPDQVMDGEGGGVQLGTGSANSGDWIQMQKSGSSVQSSRLSKLYEFSWRAALSSATLTQAVLAVAQINVLGIHQTNIPYGYGFYANLTGGLSATQWTAFLSNGSGAQFSGYSQYNTGVLVDTNTHEFAIRYITDPNTLGCGNMAFFIDGNQVAQFASSSSAIFPSSINLAMSAAMANGSGVAQNMMLYRMGSLQQP